MTSESDMLLAIEQLSTDEVDKVTDFTVKNYVKIWFTSLRDKKEFIPGNYLRFLELADPSAHYREKTAGIFFNELLKAEPTHYHRKEFLNLFSPFYTKINPTEKIQFETWLMQTFAGEFNVWDTENMLTEIVSRIWAELASKTRAGLAGYYLQFFLSESRQVKFAQKRFAIELLDKGKISSSEIERWLRQKLTEVKMNYNGTMPEEAITRVAVTYHPLKAYMDIPLDQWKGYIKKELDDISESQ